MRGPTIAGELDKDAVYSLYNRGLVYLDVPVSSEDIVMMVNGSIDNHVTELVDKLTTSSKEDLNVLPFESLYAVVASHLNKVGESTLQDLAFALDLDTRFIAVRKF